MDPGSYLRLKLSLCTSNRVLWKTKNQKETFCDQGITTTITTTTIILCRAGVRKARFHQYDDHTLRGGRKGDPQHKCCGKNEQIKQNNNEIQTKQKITHKQQSTQHNKEINKKQNL